MRVSITSCTTGSFVAFPVASEFRVPGSGVFFPAQQQIFCFSQVPICEAVVVVVVVEGGICKVACQCRMGCIAVAPCTPSLAKADIAERNRETFAVFWK